MENRPSYRIAESPGLPGPFEDAYQVAYASRFTPDGVALVEFVLWVLDEDGEETFAKAEKNEAIKERCLMLFDYCLRSGLNEDDRRRTVDLFRALAVLQDKGTRH